MTIITNTLSTVNTEHPLYKSKSESSETAPAENTNAVKVVSYTLDVSVGV